MTADVKVTVQRLSVPQLAETLGSVTKADRQHLPRKPLTTNAICRPSNPN